MIRIENCYRNNMKWYRNRQQIVNVITAVHSVEGLHNSGHWIVFLLSKSMHKYKHKQKYKHKYAGENIRQFMAAKNQKREKRTKGRKERRSDWIDGCVISCIRNISFRYLWLFVEMTGTGKKDAFHIFGDWLLFLHVHISSVLFLFLFSLILFCLISVI